tara:strand:+ start:211 stop:348 length:138 start_codon:yes stop_codon:yes gene_type:complete
MSTPFSTSIATSTLVQAAVDIEPKSASSGFCNFSLVSSSSLLRVC